jgi:hypothetical protein
MFSTIQLHVACAPAAAAVADRDNADLLRLHDRVRTHLQELTAQQQRIAAGAAEPVTVVYMASVDDEAGHEQHFRFEHKVDSRRLARAAVDEQERSKIMQEVAMAHHEEMLLVGGQQREAKQRSRHVYDQLPV